MVETQVIQRTSDACVPEKRSNKAEMAKMKELLSQAMASRNGTVQGALGGSVSIFSSLDDKHKLKQLDAVRKQLNERASDIFRKKPPSKLEMAWKATFGDRRPGGSTTESKIHGVDVLATFLVQAARQLPHDADGFLVFPTNKLGHSKIPRAYQKLYATLAGIADSAHGGNPEHAKACITATDALAELDYANSAFWLKRTADPLTRSQTLGYMLNVPRNGTEYPASWASLKELLPAYGPDIARHTSPAVAGFLFSAMQDDDFDVALSALHAAAYLPNIPPELLDIARRMQPATAAPEHIACSPELAQAAAELIVINDARSLIANGDEFAGTFALAMLHKAGRQPFLRPMLEEIYACAEEAARNSAAQPDSQEHKHALLIISTLGLAGIKVPCSALPQNDYIPIPIGIINLASRLSASEGESITQEARAAAVVLLKIRETNEQTQALGRSGGGLGLVDGQQFDAVPALIAMRSVSTPGSPEMVQVDCLLQAIGAKMADRVVNANGRTPEEQAAERKGAQEAIGMIASAGLAVPHSEFLDASIAFTTTTAVPVAWELMDTTVNGTAANCVLSMALSLDGAPQEALDFAKKQFSTAKDQATMQLANDFIFISNAKELLRHDDHRRFAGAFAIFLMYKAGRPVGHLVERIGCDTNASAYDAHRRLSQLEKLQASCSSLEADQANHGSHEHDEEIDQLREDIKALKATEATDRARYARAVGILCAIKQLDIPMPGIVIRVHGDFQGVPQEAITAAVDMMLPACVLSAGAYLTPLPPDLSTYAECLAGDTHEENYLRTAGWQFLLIREATDRIDYGDDRQFKGVYDLIGIYNAGRKDLGPLLVNQGIKMADVVMKPAISQGESEQRRKAWEALDAIDRTGLDLAYHRLRAAAYMDPVPETMLLFAEALLRQEHTPVNLEDAARDLIAINELKETLAKPGSSQFLYAHALAGLANSGSDHLQDMLEEISIRTVHSLVDAGDHPARQKALRVLGAFMVFTNPDACGIAPFTLAGDALFAAAIEPKISADVVTISKAIAKGRYPDPIKGAADDLLSVHDARGKLADAALQFEGACTLIEYYDKHRPALAHIIDAQVAPQMVKAFAGAETLDMQEAARDALAKLYASRPEAVRRPLEEAAVRMIRILNKATGPSLRWNTAHGIAVLGSIGEDFQPIVQTAAIDMAASFTKPKGSDSEDCAMRQLEAVEVLKGAYPLMKDALAAELGRHVDDMVNAIKKPWEGTRQQQTAALWLSNLPQIAGEHIAEGDEMYGLLAAVGAEMVDVLAEPQGRDTEQAMKQQVAACRILTAVYPYAIKELEPLVGKAEARLIREIAKEEVTPLWEGSLHMLADLHRAGRTGLGRELEGAWWWQVGNVDEASGRADTAPYERECKRLEAIRAALTAAGVQDEQRIRVLDVIKSLPVEEKHEAKAPEPAPLEAPAVARTGLAGLWDRYGAWVEKSLGLSMQGE